MSYLVIARKYRPVEFDDLVGQDNIVKTLKNAINDDRLSQAYLFSGTRGVGKTSLARILARALNCVEGPTVKPCNKCDSCLDILNGSSLDVFEIDGASNRRVEETQQIIENVLYAPARDKFKIYIIDEVHMLSNHAFNSLLKTIEEPPPHVIFMMATTEFNKIPQTVRSRTQHFHFVNIPQDVISSNLKKICDSESIKISDRSLNMITKEAGGSIRDAQSLLDQVIAFGGNEIKDGDVEALLGTVGGEALNLFVTAVSEKSPAQLVTLVGEAFDNGHDLLILIRKLIERFRNLLLLNVSKESLGEIVSASGDDPKTLASLSGKFSQAQLLLIFDILSHAENRMKYSQYTRFLLETALIKAALSGRLVDITSRTGSSRGSGSAPSVPGSPGRSDSSPPRITGLTPYKVMSEKESKSFEKQAVSEKKDNRIQEIIHLIAGKRKSLEMQMRGAEKCEIDDNRLIIYLSHYARKHTRETLEKNKENRQIVQDACRQVLGNGADYEIRDFIPDNLEVATEEEEGRFKGRNKFEVDKIKSEPSVQKLIDTFGGEITEYEDIRNKPMED